MGVTHRDTADDIDRGNNNPRLGIAPDKLTGTIHCPVEFAFFHDLSAALIGLNFRDGAGVEIGVNRHLLTRHSIQCKTSGHFTDSFGTLCDHNKLNNEQDDKNNKTHHKTSTGNKVAKCLDDLSGIALSQNQTR